MTQEEKLFLLKDLSARLPYGVEVNYKEDEYDFRNWKISTLYAPSYNQGGILIDTDHDGWIEYVEYKGCGMSTGSRPFHLGKVLPYLRPMSSITKEEREEIEVLIFGEWYNDCSCKVDHEGWIEILADYDVCGIDPGFCQDYTDWLLEHHFDIRGLIEKGLALEAPEGMYK